MADVYTLKRTPSGAQHIAMPESTVRSGFLSKHPVRTKFGSVKQRWLVLTPTALHWCPHAQAPPLGMLQLTKGAEVEYDAQCKTLTVSSDGKILTLAEGDETGEGELQLWRRDILVHIQGVQQAMFLNNFGLLHSKPAAERAALRTPRGGGRSRVGEEKSVL